MGIFSSPKVEDELMLVFDIGSASVAGALFFMQKSGIPKIILSISEPVIIEENLNIERFLALTMKSLDVVASRIFKAGLGAPKAVFCILASPWYVSQTRIINMVKEIPFIFTSKLADDLIKQEIEVFEKENLAKYMNENHKVRSIEFKNIKTMLNGYETSTPLNQKARELEMTIFISMSPEQILSNIEVTIQKYFHAINIKFSSFMMSSFAVVREMFINQENFLLVDIRGEVTDISMTKKSILRESVSFPIGRNFMIRGVAIALNCTLAEAGSFLSLLKDGHAEDSTDKKLGEVIDKLKTEWLQKFQESLANLSRDISIPATIYLSIEKDLATFFKEIIENEQFNQYTLTESKFKIIFLDTETLHGIAEFDKDTVRDPFVIVDSVYINRFLAKI